MRGRALAIRTLSERVQVPKASTFDIESMAIGRTQQNKGRASPLPPHEGQARDHMQTQWHHACVVPETLDSSNVQEDDSHSGPVGQ